MRLQRALLNEMAGWRGVQPLIPVRRTTHFDRPLARDIQPEDPAPNTAAPIRLRPGEEALMGISLRA